MKLSDVFWKAANRVLWDGAGFMPLVKKREYSCDAIALAGNDFQLNLRAFQFATKFGVVSISLSQFDEFVMGRERQGARYAWLMLLYELALEEESV